MGSGPFRYFGRVFRAGCPRLGPSPMQRRDRVYAAAIDGELEFELDARPHHIASRQLGTGCIFRPPRRHFTLVHQQGTPVGVSDREGPQKSQIFRKRGNFPSFPPAFQCLFSLRLSTRSCRNFGAEVVAVSAPDNDLDFLTAQAGWTTPSPTTCIQSLD